jgi:mono/diheme cytochrome c family protein
MRRLVQRQRLQGVRNSVMKQPIISNAATKALRPDRGRAWALSAPALALACGFGSVNDMQTDEPPLPPDAPEQTTETSDDPLAGNEPEETVDPPANDAPSAKPPYDPDADPFSTLLGQQARDILETSCGSCHIGIGARGDFGYLLDVPRLVAGGQVVPGNKTESELYMRMLNGTMPPADQRPARSPTPSEIEIVGQFIDELTIEDPEGDCQPLSFVDVDTQIQRMRADIALRDEAERPFTRYLTVSYSANAGDCGRVLQRQRHALFKGINSVSTSTTIVRPAPIDREETIYRIDIRDYEWNRPIDLQDNDVSDPANIDFRDGWEAIIADPRTAVYAVEYQGDAADDLVAESGTRVPFMPVNAFIQATEFGDLYYTLIGGRQSLFVFEREVLNLDTRAEADDNRLMRAGFSNSGVSEQERVLNRFDSGIGAGMSYWISFDFDGGNGGDGNGFERDVANDSIYSNPLEFAFGGGEAIFSLPNGMQGYYAADGAGNRLATAPIGVVIDPAQNNGRVTNGASCHSCHNAGLVPFTDTVRQYVLDNELRFNSETFQDVMDQYPDAATFNRQMNLDSTMHVNATERAGVPKSEADPVSRVYLDFQRVDVDLRLAAGELGVEPEVLRDNLDLLDPRLGPLSVEGGHVGREIMDATFLDSVCTLQGVQENSPVGCE